MLPSLLPVSPLPLPLPLTGHGQRLVGRLALPRLPAAVLLHADPDVVRLAHIQLPVPLPAGRAAAAGVCGVVVVMESIRRRQ